MLSFLPEPVKPLSVEVEEPDSLHSHTVIEDVERVERADNLGNESFRVHDGVSDHVQPVGTSVPPTQTYAPGLRGARLTLHLV